MTGRGPETEYLKTCKTDEVELILFHGNGAKTKGYIVDFDEKVILMNKVRPSQPAGEVGPDSMVYRSAVTNVMPA